MSYTGKVTYKRTDEFKGREDMMLWLNGSKEPKAKLARKYRKAANELRRQLIKESSQNIMLKLKIESLNKRLEDALSGPSEEESGWQGEENPKE
jgi:hypothetical protein